MIPSYDDLTPGIADVLDSESVSQLALFLRDDLPRPDNTSASSHDAAAAVVRCSATSALYACLRIAIQAEPAATECQPAACGPPPVPGASPSDRLLGIARDFSPRVMRLSDAEVLLDVSGLGRLIGEPPAIAAALTRAIADAGLTHAARVALAPTQTAARLMAAQLPGCAISRFPDLSVALLQPLETLPPAINHRDRARPYETFARWGIATLGALAALPAAELSSRLGRRGIALQRLARGFDLRPFVPDPETPRYIGGLELEWPLDTLEPLSFVLARVLEPLSVALERAGRGAAAIRLSLRLTTRETHARVLQLPAPMRDPRVLRTLLLLDLESHPPSAAVDIVSIELDPAPARVTQFLLLTRAVPSPETLSTLTARLSALVGESRIGSAVLRDTHQPGAFTMRQFMPETPMPELSLKDAADRSTLRRQRHPPAIRVSVERGRPAHLAAARRGMPCGPVTQAAGPWRSSGGWWASSGAGGQGLSHGAAAEADAVPRRGEDGWNRDEWDVALGSGAVCRIFQDRTTGRWFLEGMYD